MTSSAQPQLAACGGYRGVHGGYKPPPVVLHPRMAVRRRYLSRVVAVVAINVLAKSPTSWYFKSIRAAMFESTCHPSNMSSSKP